MSTCSKMSNCLLSKNKEQGGVDSKVKHVILSYELLVTVLIDIITLALDRVDNVQTSSG